MQLLKQKYLLVIILILVFSSLFSFGRKIDSLYIALQKQKTDTIQMRLMVEIGILYQRELPDSALVYFQKAHKLALLKSNDFFTAKSLQSIGVFYYYKGENETALKYYNEAFNVIKDNNEFTCQKLKASLLKGRGLSTANLGNYEEAYALYQKSIALLQELIKGTTNVEEIRLLQISLSGCYNNIGMSFWDKGDFSMSIIYFQKSLKIREESGDKKGIADCNNNIGMLHSQQQHYEKALDYLNKALRTFEELGDKAAGVGCIMNMANVYADKKQPEKAFDYNMKALNICEELGDKKGMSTSFSNLGTIKLNEKEYEQAIQFFLRSLDIDCELGDKKGQSEVLNSIAKVHLQRGIYASAIAKAGEALKISQEIGAIKEVSDSYKIIANSYDSLNQPVQAYYYYKLFVTTNDSLNSVEKEKKMAEVEEQYQGEKKQKQIELQNAQLKRKEVELKQETTIKYGMSIGLLLVILFAGYIFRSLRDKKKANARLTELNDQVEFKNSELNQQNEEITAQRDEIEAQRDLVTEQKQQIERIHTEVSQSIDYAKRLQAAVLPEETLLTEIFHSHFVLFKPKDKVSGDFYWWAKVEGQIIVTVADCTGHGVPGAFMSMLGTSFLREIVQNEYITSPAVILRKLRKEIIKSLKQKGIQGEQKDGMDMALISYNKETKVLHFAGANNPMLIIRKNSEKGKTDFDRMIDVRADKMPIAIYENMSMFNNHEFHMQPGDTVYLFSDGYVDQFGGPKKKKFLSKNFRQLLLDINEKTMEEQKVILNDTIEEWKKGNVHHEQIDDISVVGIRV